MENRIKGYRFFTPTKRLRQYFLLDAIGKDGKLSQRDLSTAAGISPSVVNKYLREFEEESLIEKESLNERDFKYSLTNKGSKRRREFMVEYIRETFQLFSTGKEELAHILNNYYRNKGCREVIFYSAGEVTELLIHSLEHTELDLLAVADDDKKKQGKKLFGYPVISWREIKNFNPDAVIITTFRYRDQIYERIKGLEQEGIAVFGF